MPASDQPSRRRQSVKKKQDKRTVIALGLLSQLGQVHRLITRFRVHREVRSVKKWGRWIGTRGEGVGNKVEVAVPLGRPMLHKMGLCRLRQSPKAARLRRHSASEKGGGQQPGPALSTRRH